MTRRLLLLFALMLGWLALGCGGSDDTYSPSAGGGGGTTGNPTFNLAVTPTTQAVEEGEAATYTVTLTAVDGFSSPVELSVPDLPPGLQAEFAQSTLELSGEGASTTLTVSPFLTLDKGKRAVADETLSFIVRAAGGGITREQSVTLVINTEEPQDFTLEVAPGGRVIGIGDTAQFEVRLTSVAGYAESVTLSVVDQVGAADVQFAPNPVTPTGGGATAVLAVTPTDVFTTIVQLTVRAEGADGTAHEQTVTVTVDGGPQRPHPPRRRR